MESDGACDIFTGAMATAVTRYATKIKILADATFTTLTFKFPGGEVQAANPNAITYLAASSIELLDVKTFKLLTGSIMVYFGHAKGTA